jgi:acetamidase/formamidase
MLGPVEVRAAMPGDVVECALATLRTIDWGWNSFPLGVGALPSDFKDPYVHYFRFDQARETVEFTHAICLPMAPFLGVVGVEPAGSQPISAILGGAHGGNLVLRDFTVGSSLFLPVLKPGARIWTGDVHALQGDGVVDQTAIETAAEDLSIAYHLHKNVALRRPLLETKSAWICIGFGENLDDAIVACLREVIHWLSNASGISQAEIYALASLSASFRVTQYSNQTASAYRATPPKAVHAVIAKDIFPAEIRDRIQAWLRPT